LGYITDGWVPTSQSGLVALDSTSLSAHDLINDANVLRVATNNDGAAGQPGSPSGGVRTDLWPVATVFLPNWASASASDSADYSVSLQRMSEVPIPAAGYLLLSALAGLASIKRFAPK
jgi:hypothetical protein